MFEYVFLIVLTILSVVFFMVGMWLAVSDDAIPINRHTDANKLNTVIANKRLGSLYIIGSMITLAILWS